MRLAVLVCSLVVSLAASAGAGTLYVAPDGSDSNAGTLEAPLQTPGAAVAKALPGDTILLRGGTYVLTKPLNIDVAGLTLAGYRRPDGALETALLYGATDQLSALPNMVVIYADAVTVADLQVRGGAYYGIKVDNAYRNPADVRILRVRIYETGRDCIKTQNADRLLIEDVDLGPSGVRDASNAEGIDVIGSLGVTIRRCYIHDIATNGLYLKGGTVGGLVEGCRIERTGEAGLLLGSETASQFMRNGVAHEAIDSIARNNVILDTAMAGLGSVAGSNVRFENNTLVNVARSAQAGFRAAPNQYGTPATGVVLYNTIVVITPGSTRPYLSLFDLSGPLVSDYNIWWAQGRAATFQVTSGGTTTSYSTLTAWQNASGADLRSQIADPLFDTSGAPVLSGSSPAIDAGTALTGVTVDYFGTSRPQGAAFDIGAHERVASTTSPEPPAAPSDVVGSVVAGPAIHVSWTDNSSDEDGFQLERSVDGAPFSTIATLAAGATSHTDYGVSAGSSYLYRVRAFNDAGNSSYATSAAITIAAQPVPSAPTGLSATAGRTHAALAWTDTSSNETGFTVERSTNGSSYAAVATLAANTQAWTDTGLRSNKLYYYRVRAFNASGSSPYSNVVSVRTTRK